MQRCDAVSQTCPPSPQSTEERHRTQRLVVVSQRGRKPAVQFASLVHCTQIIFAVLQAGVPLAMAMHCVSVAQDVTHRFVVVSQTIPASPQLALVMHWTHEPAGEQ
jgi:ABC-type nitrate/sulfonate/bicarbonate transport system permease component